MAGYRQLGSAKSAVGQVYTAWQPGPSQSGGGAILARFGTVRPQLRVQPLSINPTGDSSPRDVPPVLVPMRTP